jgi:hypothetical protein
MTAVPVAGRDQTSLMRMGSVAAFAPETATASKKLEKNKRFM